MKTSKRIISFVLCAIMFASCFFCTGKLPELEAKAADITIGGITQTRVVSNYESVYREYQKRFFNGEETNWPTNFVIPGLGRKDANSSYDDYTPQGMTYWEAKEWILISAYDATESGKNSVVYALDVKSTNLVAVFKIQNADGSVNTSHGGGIAASEYNFYYADSGSKISYIPLSEMDISGGEKTIRLRDSINCASELGSAYTSYCCYEDGVLWAGNFYLNNTKYDYGQKAHSTSDSMIVGYRLRGNSSEEEWNNLQRGNIITPKKLGSNIKGDDASIGLLTYSASLDDRGYIDISGNVAAGSSEDYSSFGTAYLEDGVTYKLEFDVDANSLDFNFYFIKPDWSSINDINYIYSPNTQWKENLDLNGNFNGTYHVVHTFTVGEATPGANTNWGSIANPSGEYNIRFDQDNNTNAHSVSIQNIRIVEVVEGFNEGFTTDSEAGYDCEGNPSYVVTIPTVDKIQYAMVSKGKMYISRSWSRTEGSTHTRELMIADIDLGSPGTADLEINNRTRPCHVLDVAKTTRFGGDKSNSSHNLTKMLYMGESLCVINDYLYMFGEGAAWNYNGKDSSSVCPEPIDVLWKIDQYAIQGLVRPHEDVTSVEYEKVSSLSQLNSKDEYIIVHQSPLKDPVSQNNILYVLDAFGGYGDKKLPKKASSSEISASSTGNSIGVIGYEISSYSVKTENNKTSIILSAEDDANKSMHWQFESGTSTSLKLYNRDLYYAKHPYFYSGDTLFAMTTNAGSMTIADLGNGNFNISGNGYKIWCNDGSDSAKINAYTNYYLNSNITAYTPNYHDATEVAGTFHTHNSNNPATGTAEQQVFHIYKRVTDPYASSYETQVYTDLQAELTADGTYDITLETYSTNALQYQRVSERPTDFIFVVDVSGSMDRDDCYGYHTESGWDPLTMGQACGDKSGSFFDEGKNYNTAFSGKYYYKFPDGEYGQIHVAYNKKDSDHTRDIWLWAEHPITKRCYRLSKFGFMTHGNFSGGAVWADDSKYRITDADFLANHEKLGWANEAAVMADVNADRYRTDYHGSRNSDDKRAAYEVFNFKCNEYDSTHKEQVVVTNSYYTLISDAFRSSAVRNTIEKLTYKIAQGAQESGLDHRIALVTSGSDGTWVSDNRPWANTGIYTNSNGWINYTGDGSITDAQYKDAFVSASNFAKIRNQVLSMDVYGHTPLNQGLTLASNIIEKSGTKYDINGTRSAVVVVFSDGAAGGDNSSYNNATNANTAANAAIGGGALSLKRNGAYIYTIQVGTDHYVNGTFSETDFMKYMSSKYTGATSMSDPGPLNTKEYGYFIQVPTNSIANLDSMGTTIYEAIVSNSQNSISYLSSSSILREQLTDAFDLTNATITYQLATSRYDGIGRLYFDNPQTVSGITGTIDRTTNEIIVKGYDYTAKNVSEYNSDKGNGAKLVVKITGVVANRDKELLNTSINDTTKTAIYQNQTYFNSNQPVKKFPTFHFSIPEYTYVLDYDLPMLDTDINGTLVSVDTEPDKQDVKNYRTNLQTDVLGVEFVDNKENMLYSLNSQEGSTEKNSRAYVLIKRDDGSYDWFRLNIIPASTVYFEDNKTKTLAGTESYADWTPNGSYEGIRQTAVSEGDVFGNDPLYAKNANNFSLGTHLETTVTSSNNRSDTKTFSFIGTGFDLVSACGPNTGIQTVVVKKVETDENGNKTAALKKVYIVDTYYGDTTYGTIYQAPIVHFEESPEDANLDGSRNEYIVETTAAYYSFAGALAASQSVSTEALGETGIDAYTATAETSVTDDFFASIGMDELIGQDVELVWMDDDSVLNGGEGATETIVSTQADGLGTTTTTPAKSLVNYIDGFRIYNPLTEAEANANYPTNEKNANYYNLISNLGSGTMTGSSLFGYVEGSAGSFSFADYSSLKGKAPKNEIYLNSNASNGVIFNLNVTGDISAKLAMRAVSGSPEVKINGKIYKVTNKSEQYFDITEAVKDQSTVTINVYSNGAKDLVAISNLRLNNASVAALTGDDLENVARMMTMAATPVTYDPLVEYTPAPTFVTAPADNPNIDPVGRIPTFEEYIAINGITPPKDDSHIYSFADKIIAIIEKVIEFIKKVVALVVNTFSSMI